MQSTQHRFSRSETDIPSLKRGGTMKKKGVAQLHKDEHVMEPRGKKGKKKSGRMKSRSR